MSELITVQPVILAGGSGTRLWPISRGDYPKQLLNLDGDRDATVDADRLLNLERDFAQLRSHPPMVVAGEDIRFLVADQMNTGNPAPSVIALEPVARNSARYSGRGLPCCFRRCRPRSSGDAGRPCRTRCQRI